MNRQAEFLSNLGTIERIITAICRRYLLAYDDCDDFGSYVKIRLMDGDYAVFAKFQGRSSLPTYLTVVIKNCFRDHRASRWGRWRHSAEAKRLGPIARKLEILLYRDGHGVREAIRVLRSAGGELPSDTELLRLAEQIPPRTPTQEINPTAAENTVAPETADDIVQQNEAHQQIAAALKALDSALQTLDPEDQLIVRMRYMDGLSVPEIARVLNLESKPLYRRCDNNLARLRPQLEELGIRREMIANLFFE